MSLDKAIAKANIENGQAILGIEFGSTRIKAVLIGEDNSPIAGGAHDWENDLVDGIWTYSLEKVEKGLQDCYQNLLADVKAQYDTTITSLKAIGFSAMMHGYIVFDKDNKQLVPFRTWRNTITAKASEELTEKLNFHIPQRWSIAHLYQAILNGEPHVKDIAWLTTLAGYIQWKMTGNHNMGVGEASGMFPIDAKTGNYNEKMVETFDELVAPYGFGWKLKDLLPEVLTAGVEAGKLTAEGAAYLDVSGQLQAGAAVCPCEGDAGTGMVATNAVAVRTGNVSAGTSAFGMVVLEDDLKNVHDELDMVTTPDGHPVAMAHCNNCTSDLNAWVGIFKEFTEALGVEVDMGKLFSVLYTKSLEGDVDCGGLLAYNYFSGEHITGMEEGRPLFVRTPESKFNLANFMRVNLYTSIGVVKTGLDILFKEEGVKIDEIMGHGGLFKTKGVGQRFLAAALDTPVSVMETAGEGGAWGIALLGSYMMNKLEGEDLAAFLNRAVFAGEKGTKLDPIPEEVAGFNAFIERYSKGLAIERAAIDSLK